MPDVVLFHYVMGLTDGVRAFAEELGAGGHAVRTPDLYHGRVAASLQDGFAITGEIGPETLEQRVEAALADLGGDLVFAGMSSGVMHAQRLAQTRPGARGALLYEACVPVTGEWAFGAWPEALAAQVHGMDDDEFFAHEGDLAAARELSDAAGDDLVEVFTYPGGSHLFLDSSLETYDAAATSTVLDRSRAFLDRLA
ncbi:dienelactone hydrolase family protein [Ilumatobacter sp.]|uniref:dienelactone hydrolase family protein n=1 Tax=Ilumatobacter sp. TaxID=1967498 RepID=UPI003B517DE2